MKLKSPKLYLFSLIGILIFATFVRLIKLDKTPSGFHADEASFYINALAISKTGADEDGKKLPLSLSSFIDPKPAIFSYFQVPFIMTIDNQVLAARLPSVILSIFSLSMVYLLISKVSDNKIGLLTTFILSISPWHIIISRGTQEVIASFFFLLLSIYLIIIYFEKQKKSILLIGSFFVSSFLSMYFYHSAKLLLPLLIFGYLLYIFKKSKTFIKTSFLILFITTLSLFLSLSIQESGSRIAAVGILADEAPQHRLIEQIYTLHEQLPITTVRIFYNKIGAYSHAIIAEYVAYFSPDFLFLKGGKPNRYIVPGVGLLYLVELPLILLGLYSSIQSKKKKSLLFLGLLAIAPIPAALTRLETPSVIRAFPMIISLAYFISIGIKTIWKLKNKYIKFGAIATFSLVYLWQIGYFIVQYDVQTYYDQPWYRNSPYTEIAKEVSKISENYSEIRVTNDLRPLYTYFVIENLIDISDLQNNPHARDTQEYSLGKFTFNRGVCELGDRKSGVLYIAETQCRNQIEDSSLFEVVATISYQDNTPVYELLQIKQ